MPSRQVIIVGAIFFLSSLAFSQSSVILLASKLEEDGKFKEAAAILQMALSDDRIVKSQEQRKKLEFELDRLERIRGDYSLTEEKLYEILAESVDGLTPQEFESWIAEGRFDGRVVDGTVYYVGPSRSNLFFRYPELASRRIHPSDDSAFEQSLWETVVSIKSAAKEVENPFVLPKRFRNMMTVTVKPNAVPAGETVRAWLPIPRMYPHQRDFKVVSSSSPVGNLDSEHSSIRSVYLEQEAEADHPTEFMVEYEYTSYGVFFDLKPDAIQPYNRNGHTVEEYTKEAPHVLFTEKIKRLSRELVGREKNPLLKAKTFYDWISENIQYSYALEYSTIRNISEYCLDKKYGDCGQAALLFITLCRYNGIPARWQSGWFTMPGGKTIHDWTEVYFEPYGWVPVDPYRGVFAMQYFSGTIERRKAMRDFYFGGLDQYRMAANSDHNQELVPPKRTLRSDNVDFQRGELEYGDTNLYFDTYSFNLSVKGVELRP